MNVLNMFPKLIKRTMIFSGLAMLLVLQGCFHSDDPAPVPDAVPTGYYTGTLSVTGISDTSTVHALVNGNRLMLMSLTEGLLYDGTMTITGNGFTTTATIYDDGTATGGTTDISGTITEGSQITGDLAGSGIGLGSFTLTYATSNNETAAVSRIESSVGNPMWVGNLYGVVTADLGFTLAQPSTWTHAQDAALGTFEDCFINGSISSISSTNLYNVSLSAGANTCINTPGANISYSGLATTLADPGADDTLLIAFSGVGYAIIGKFK